MPYTLYPRSRAAAPKSVKPITLRHRGAVVTVTTRPFADARFKGVKYHVTLRRDGEVWQVWYEPYPPTAETVAATLAARRTTFDETW